MTINNTIYTSILNATGQIAILIDPEKTNKEEQWRRLDHEWTYWVRVTDSNEGMNPKE